MIDMTSNVATIILTGLACLGIVWLGSMWFEKSLREDEE